jgi:hypothetical protein
MSGVNCHSRRAGRMIPPLRVCAETTAPNGAPPTQPHPGGMAVAPASKGEVKRQPGGAGAAKNRTRLTAAALKLRATAARRAMMRAASILVGRGRAREIAFPMDFARALDAFASELRARLE